MFYIFNSDGEELDGPFTSRLAAEYAAADYDDAYVDTAIESVVTA